MTVLSPDDELPESVSSPTPRELHDEEWEVFAKMRTIASHRQMPYFAQYFYQQEVRMLDNPPEGTVMGVGKDGKVYLTQNLLLSANGDEKDLAKAANALGYALMARLNDYEKRGEEEENKKAWNVGANLALSDDFQQDHLDLPKGLGETADQFKEKFVDWKYKVEKLQEMQANGTLPPELQGQVPTEPPPPVPDIHNWQLPEWYYKRIEYLFPPEEQDGDFPQSGCGLTGSGMGDPQDWEEEPTKSEALSQAELDMAAQEAEEYSKTRGDVPGNMLATIKEFLKPAPIPWEQYLLTEVITGVEKTRGSTTSSYHRLNRRFPVSEDGLAFPTQVAYTPRVGVIVDTSGSMSNQDLQAALGTIGDLLETIDTPVDVVCVDAAASEIVTINDPSQIQITGRGGTDMRVGFDLMRKSGVYDTVICLTDCETPWPEKEYDGVTEIVVGIFSRGYKQGDNPDEYRRSYDIPEWMSFIPVSSEELQKGK